MSSSVLAQWLVNPLASGARGHEIPTDPGDSEKKKVTCRVHFQHFGIGEGQFDFEKVACKNMR